jgi:hypothetical protein
MELLITYADAESVSSSLVYSKYARFALPYGIATWSQMYAYVGHRRGGTPWNQG